MAESIGFESFSSALPATATHDEVLECIQRHNKDPRWVHETINIRMGRHPLSGHIFPVAVALHAFLSCPGMMCNGRRAPKSW